MKKKRLIIHSVVLGSIAIIATSVGVGYKFNSESNQYSNYYRAPASSADADLIQAYFSAAVTGTKMLYLPGFAHKAPLVNSLNVSEENNAPLHNYLGKTGYLLIDDIYGFPSFLREEGKTDKIDPNVQQGFYSTNVASAQFRSDLGSFITAVATAQFLNENKEYFLEGKDTDKYGKLTWATYGGLPFSSVTSFMGGFQRGMEWFNDNIAKKYPDKYMEIEEVNINGGQGHNFVGGFDPNQGDAIITTYYSEVKPSAFFPIAGPQTQAAVRLLKQNTSLRTLIVGADSAMEYDEGSNGTLNNLNGKTVGNNQIIQFSSVKNVDVITQKITERVNDGITYDDSLTNENEFIGGLGYHSLATPNNKSVGVSENGKKYFVKAMYAYHGLESPPDNSNWNELYEQQIISSEVQRLFDWLNLPEQKVYVETNKTDGTTASYSYADIPNVGQRMIPIASDMQEIEKWYDNTYPTHDETVKQENLAFIQEWKHKNEKTINERKSFTLKNILTKEHYDKDKRICKIISQAPTNILFDKSFLQSCYVGLIQYWKMHDIELPIPNHLKLNKTIKGN